MLVFFLNSQDAFFSYFICIKDSFLNGYTPQILVCIFINQFEFLFKLNIGISQQYAVIQIQSSTDRIVQIECSFIIKFANLIRSCIILRHEFSGYQLLAVCILLEYWISSSAFTRTLCTFLEDTYIDLTLK